MITKSRVGCAATGAHTGATMAAPEEAVGMPVWLQQAAEEQAAAEKAAAERMAAKMAVVEKAAAVRAAVEQAAAVAEPSL